MTESTDISVLVIGAGSIGRRHLRNLRALGISMLSCCEPDGERLSAACSEVSAAPFSDLEAALAPAPTAVFVCTPPVFHVEQAMMALRAGSHVFLEKPLSNSLDGVAALTELAQRSGRVIQVGYNLRSNPGVKKLKELLDAGEIGRVLWARAEFGQYLPDWRPTQDYRESYTARQDLGGGIVLDGSHELDYILWLLGEPVEMVCMAGKVSGLVADVEDCATILLRFANGAQADVHVDFVQRGYHRSCKIAGERGNLLWDYSSNQVRMYRAEKSEWTAFPYEFQPNDMYVSEVKAFLECIQGNGSPVVTLAEAARVLELAIAAKRAAMTRREGTTA